MSLQRKLNYYLRTLFTYILPAQLQYGKFRACGTFQTSYKKLVHTSAPPPPSVKFLRLVPESVGIARLSQNKVLISIYNQEHFPMCSDVEIRLESCSAKPSKSQESQRTAFPALT